MFSSDKKYLVIKSSIDNKLYWVTYISKNIIVFISSSSWSLLRRGCSSPNWPNWRLSPVGKGSLCPWDSPSLLSCQHFHHNKDCLSSYHHIFTKGWEKSSGRCPWNSPSLISCQHSYHNCLSLYSTKVYNSWVIFTFNINLKFTVWKKSNYASWCSVITWLRTEDLHGTNFVKNTELWWNSMALDEGKGKADNWGSVSFKSAILLTFSQVDFADTSVDIACPPRWVVSKGVLGG